MRGGTRQGSGQDFFIGIHVICQNSLAGATDILRVFPGRVEIRLRLGDIIESRQDVDGHHSQRTGDPVTGAVDKAVLSLEIQLRRVEKRSIRIEDHRAMSRTAFHGAGQTHPVEIRVIVQQAAPGAIHNLHFHVKTKIGALRVALVDLHRKDVVPLHKKGRRDGRQFNLKIAVVHRALGKVVVGWVGLNIVDTDPCPIEKDHDPVIAENPTGGAHNLIHVLNREGTAKVGGGILVPGIATETNLAFLVTVPISQFSRTTIPLRIVVTGIPPLTAKIRAGVVEPPFRSIGHHRFRTPRCPAHIKSSVLLNHITVIPGDRRIRPGIHCQGYHRQPGLQRSIAGTITESVCPEKVVIGRINECSIRIQGERSVLHILSLNRAQIPTFRITIVGKHSHPRKAHLER